MAEGAAGTKARCVSCRVDVLVPDQYAHGDHIACGTCGTKHKVARGDRVRLVLADAAPLRDALAQNQHAIQRLKSQLTKARASFGIGANGFGIGVIFVVYQVGWRGHPLDLTLLGNAIGIAVVSGLLLEAANWAFLAKRKTISRLSAELTEAEVEARQLRQKIRDATRL